jgi:SAM-dependent methyltransferase
VLYRQINKDGGAAFDSLEASGFFQDLIQRGWLLPYASVDVPPYDPAIAARVIRPDEVPCISYPYEWSFSQLKAAALLMLGIQRQALERGAVLKDASAYNIQFLGSRPVLIDHLSFAPYEEGSPWVAYRQFCEHFLGPLALMAHRDVRLSQLLRIHLDGIPLDLVSRLLPWKTRWSTGLLAHIHFHARNQRALASSGPSRPVVLSKARLQALLSHLEATVQSLRWEPRGTEWADYYQMTNYSADAADAKAMKLREWLKELPSGRVLDLGANTGVYSQVAAEAGRTVLSVDSDPAAVERLARGLEGQTTSILPLIIDLVNPSPALGWGSVERQSFLERAQSEVVLALALVHHLAISNNTPLETIAKLFAQLGRYAIVEFVPKEDSQVQKLLRTRLDIFPNYTIEGFEAAVSPVFTVKASAALPGSSRRLYLLERR